MVPRGRGTVLFTGASGSLRGRALFAAFAAAKAGGGIEGDRLLAAFPDRLAEKGPEGLLSIDAIAETYWQLHQQPRSAWTHELELRPWTEPF